MKLKVLGSSSAGNCYIMKADNGETLIIEAGVKFSQVKKALDFDLNNVFVIVSHSHGDHSKYIKQALDAYIPVFSSKECLTECGVLDNPSSSEIVPGQQMTYGRFKFFAFEVQHDVRCFAFLIYHPECGSVLFATDTYDIPQRFEGVNNIIIEANYDYDILTRNMERGGVDPRRKQRIVDSHMEISRTIHILKRNDLTAVNNIVLIHLSDQNSNADDFKKRVETATGRTTHIADKGLEIEFNKTPF